MGPKLPIASLFLVLLVLSNCKEGGGPTKPPSPPTDSVNAGPKIVQIYPPVNSQGPYENFYPAQLSQIKVVFNKCMNFASVCKAVAITSTAGDIRVDTNLITSIANTAFFITPSDSTGRLISFWRIGQRYTFTISSVAHDTSGNKLQPPFSMNFMPEPTFRVTGVTDSLAVSAPFYVKFNGLVDTSIFSAINILPQVTATWHLSYDSMSVYANLSGVQNTDVAYIVNVTVDAHDKEGNHLPQDFTTTFRFTSSPFRITTFIPSNMSNQVSLSDDIYVGCTMVIDTGSIRSAFHIRPPIAGQFLISGEVYFFYVPVSNFLPETTYTVSIDSSLRALGGPSLSRSYVFSFQTLPFEVISTVPGDGQINVQPSTFINVDFDAFIDPGSVPGSFSLVDPSNTIVEGEFLSSPEGFSFLPSTVLKSNTAYRVSISNEMRTREGWHLKNSYTFSFRTGG